MARVTVGISMDSEFVKLLNSNVYLSGLRAKDEMQPIDQLALLVLMEARGATEAESHAAILPTWRPHIEAVSELRTVAQEPRAEGEQGDE